MSRSYYTTSSAAFQYTMAGGDSGSGGGSGMECLQLRSPPGPFHYLISEQAKSFVALQELQNEVGALLEFRDLVIETFPNLRSKMGPASPAAGRGAGRGEWEPGVRVRRKLPAAGDAARAKPQPSVQDSGFSTETSCGKDNAPPAAAPPAPLEDELWQLLDVIQRKGGRLRDEVELLRGDLRSRSPSPAPSPPPFAPDSARAEDAHRLRAERDALLEGRARLDAAAAAELAELRATKRELEERLRARSPATPPARAALGKLDAVLATPVRSLRVNTPDSKKFAAILQESSPVELQRHLLNSTVHTQVLVERLNRVSNHRAVLLDRLERAKEENDDLKFRLEEKSIELEGTKARMRVLERGANSDVESEARSHGSMRAMRPLTLPEPRIHETPRRVRPSRIPLPPSLVSQGGSRAAPPAPRTRPNDSLSRMPRDSPSASVSAARTPPQPAAKKLSSVPVRRANSAAAQRGGAGGKDDAKHNHAAPLILGNVCDDCTSYLDSLNCSGTADRLISEYLTRTDRLARNQRLFFRKLYYPNKCHNGVEYDNLQGVKDMELAYESPQNLAAELSKSILYSDVEINDKIKDLNINSLNVDIKNKDYSDDSLWNGKPQQYFESMNNEDAFGDSINVNDKIESGGEFDSLTRFP